MSVGEGRGRARLPATLLTHALLLQLAAYIVRPGAAYRALELGMDVSLLGLVAASFAIVPLLTAVLIGRVADRGGDTLLLALGAVLIVASAIVLLVAPNLPLLLIGNAVLGLGHLMAVLGEQSRVAQAASERVDAAFGAYTFAGSIGQALGPAALGLAAGAAAVPNTTVLFAISLGVCVLLAAVTVPLLRGHGHAAADRPPRLSLRQAIPASGAERRTLFGAIALSMMVLAAVDLFAVYLPALGIERGIPAAVIGLLLSLRAATTMASRLGLGRLVDLMGRTRLVVIATAVAAVTVALVAVPMPVWLLAVVIAVAGIGLGIGQPVSMAIVSVGAPPGSRGTWLAIRLTANRLGQAGVPLGVGLVAAATGAGGVFAATAALLAVTAAVVVRREPSG